MHVVGWRRIAKPIVREDRLWSGLGVWELGVGSWGSMIPTAFISISISLSMELNLAPRTHRVAPVIRCVEGALEREVPVRHAHTRVDRLHGRFVHESVREVARHKSRALVPVVAVGGAAIVKVHAVEVVLRLVLRAPDALPRLRRNNRHDRDGLEEALAVEVGHRANLSPHVLDHDLDGHTRRHFAVLLLCKQHVIPPHRCERHVNRLAVALCVALHCPFVPRLRVRILRLHRRRDVRLRNI
mmetsp:Transcript_5807/g.13658  ORF Transcript_5807/g.13658 Transcript_5807/m.13658 type:complete len:242 (-) Transcript_5807:121-846(-)